MRTAELGKDEAVGELARTTSKLDDAVRDRRLLQATVASVQVENNRLKAETAQAVAAAAKANKDAAEANGNLQGEVKPLLARAHAGRQAHTHTRARRQARTHTHTHSLSHTHHHHHIESQGSRLAHGRAWQG